MYEEYYKRGDQISLVNNDGKFIYEVNVYAIGKNYFSLCNTAKYSSYVAIDGIVDSYFILPHVQICAELFSAPEKWLKENGFIQMKKELKVKKPKNVKKTGID